MRAARREREACLEGRQLRQHFTVPKPSWGGQAGPLYLKITYTNLNKLGSFQSFTCKYVTTQETSIFPVSSIITGKQLAHRQVGLLRFFHSFLPSTTHALLPAPTQCRQGHSKVVILVNRGHKIKTESQQKALETARIFPSSSPRIPVQKSSYIKFSLKGGGGVVVSEN